MDSKPYETLPERITPPAVFSVDTAPKKVVGRPFQRGMSGNPRGRPAGTSLTSVLRKQLTIENRKVLCLRLFEKAAAGDVAALKLIWDRVDGLQKAGFNINLDGDPPMAHESARDYYERQHQKLVDRVQHYYPDFNQEASNQRINVIIEDVDETIE